MTLRELECGAVKVLRPEGPLKGDDADLFRERIAALVQSSLGRCVVDASAVPFVDSRGLEALVEANEQIARSGHPLRLCGVNETVREVLDLTGLAPLFEYFADVNSAVRSFL